MRLKLILLGAACGSLFAGAAAADLSSAVAPNPDAAATADADATAAPDPQTTIIQLGANKGDRVAASPGVAIKTEQGVTVVRAAPLPPAPPRAATPMVVERTIEKRVVVLRRYIWPIRHLRTVGFFSGHPGHTRRFTQGFFSGPPDLDSCD